MITGATGTLGKAFARICEKRGLAYHLLSRQELDIAAPASVKAAFEHYDPWAVVNAAGYVRVDDAEFEPETCVRDNVLGPTLLARACADRGAAFVTFSSDLVFDGTKKGAYVESDPALPINVYGRSKLEAEVKVLAELSSALVIRTSAFFGPWDEFNFVTAVLTALSQGRRFSAANDVAISPTYVPDLVNATLDLLIDGERGIWHLANSGGLTWWEFARLAAEMAGYDPGCIDARPNASFGLIAARPSSSLLSSERANLLPSLERGLSSYYQEKKQTALSKTDKAIST